jgi:hypothetical protein
VCRVTSSRAAECTRASLILWLVIVGVGMEFCFAKDGAMDELLFGGKVHECIFES